MNNNSIVAASSAAVSGAGSPTNTPPVGFTSVNPHAAVSPVPANPAVVVAVAASPAPAPAPAPYQPVATGTSPFTTLPQVGIYGTMPSPPVVPDTPSASVFSDLDALESVGVVVAPPPAPAPLVPPAPVVTQPLLTPTAEAAEPDESVETFRVTVPSVVVPHENWPVVPVSEHTPPWKVLLHTPKCLECSGIVPFDSAVHDYHQLKCKNAPTCPAGMITFSSIGLYRNMVLALKRAQSSGNAAAIAAAIAAIGSHAKLSEEERQNVLKECGII